ncbi:hypothetical protein ASD04_14865 [Devosia sp. Root436]|uniref:hypothetical protein n=1 Tax=Devosia sp. Root436 TaxID=1736537 RepID=UPI0006FD455F|nr:hypothetical protein [Devosia sp. Root436]KQX35320.1 hypothetical protein ASD04_14865 [Devosia sp. Root436]
MGYKLFPGAVPSEYVLATISLVDDLPVATLTTGGPAAEGADYIFVPIEPMPVPQALQRGAATAAKARKPFFIRLQDGTEWNADWGAAPTA